MTGRDALLVSLMDCGELDLKLIDDVGYDWCDIFAGGAGAWEAGDFNSIIRQVFRYGFQQIEEAVSDRICELEAIPNERELDEDEEKELAALRELRPTAGDFDSYHNYLDTHVYCEKHGETYKKYLQDALDAFADGTGFEVTICE